jgi:hypothetical protein
VDRYRLFQRLLFSRLDRLGGFRGFPASIFGGQPGKAQRNTPWSSDQVLMEFLASDGKHVGFLLRVECDANTGMFAIASIDAAAWRFSGGGPSF